MNVSQNPRVLERVIAAIRYCENARERACGRVQQCANVRMLEGGSTQVRIMSVQTTFEGQGGCVAREAARVGEVRGAEG